MKKSRKRILSLLFALILMITNVGDLQLFAAAAGEDLSRAAGDAYSIVGRMEEVNRRTYVFYVPRDNNSLNDYESYREYEFSTGLIPVELDDSSIVTEQTVTGGAGGRDPQLPVLPRLSAAAEEIFDGWYAGTLVENAWEVDESAPYDFTQEIREAHETVCLFARYHPFAYVVFHDSEAENSPIAFIRRVELNKNEQGNHQGTLVIDEELSVDYRGNRRLVGWKLFGAADTPATITVGPGRTDLYPVFQGFAWLEFYTAAAGTGATYVPSMAVSRSGVEGPLPVPELSGYDFTGWYADNGTQVTNAQGVLVGTGVAGQFLVDGNKLIPFGDMRLNARWSPKTAADYLVVVWTQKRTDAQGLAYDYYESRQFLGAVGAQAADQTNFREYRQQLNAQLEAAGFDVHHPRTEQVVIAADGSTVLNVYYDCTQFYSAQDDARFALRFADSAEPASFDETQVPPAEDLAYGAEILSLLNGTTPPPREGYTFTGWYMDPACRVLAAPSAAEGQVSANLTTMPERDVTLYAGWELEWYLVQIDPNYGALYSYLYDQNGGYITDGEGNRKMSGAGSTWMWKSRESDLLQEYTHVTRDFVESSAGDWYYVNHNYDYYGGDPLPDADRKTYYTQDASEATSFETYEKVTSGDVYSYADWYEVLADGSETPYDFTAPITHDTYLRLHWKKSGSYYIAYNPVAHQDGITLQGTLDSGGTSEALFQQLEQEKYADNAEVLVLRNAEAPRNSGYAFAGWRIRGDESGALYGPGELFTLHSDNAVRQSGKDTVYLDAVYVKLSPAEIIYDANGGSVSETGGDDGYGLYGGYSLAAYHSADVFPSTPICGHDGTTASISNLVNNSVVTLSRGEGFTGEDGAALAGWCARPDYDPEDAACPLYAPGEDFVIVDSRDPVTLYAVWGVKVTYHLVSAGATAEWDPAVYVPGESNAPDSRDNTYARAAFAGSVITEPSPAPSSNDPGKVFYFWTTAAGEADKEFDFSQPIPGALDLYAFWGAPGTVPVRAAWGSAAGVTAFDGAASFTAGAAGVDPSSKLSLVRSELSVEDSYGYDFAVVCSESRLSHMTRDDAVSAVYYDSKTEKVRVRYADPVRAEESMKAGESLWFLFYQEKTLNIAHVGTGTDGLLEPVTAGDPASVTSPLGLFDASQLSLPHASVIGSHWTYYSFAVGPAYIEEGEDRTEVSDLQLFSAPVPVGSASLFRVRNSWRGFQCSLDGENWLSCGYQPQLYVVYFEHRPTLIRIWETTHANRELVEETAFRYTAGITSSDGTPERSFAFTLKNGEAKTIVACCWTDASAETRTQTVTVTQDPAEGFVTKLTGGASPESDVFTFTTSGDVWTKTGAFANYHEQQKLEVRAAVIENGKIVPLSDESVMLPLPRTVALPGGDAEDRSLAVFADAFHRDSFDFLEELSSDALIEQLNAQLSGKGLEPIDISDYTFSAVIYGSAEGGAVTAKGMDVASVAYAQREKNNIYELVLKNSAGNTLDELGSDSVYYLYFRMPEVRYMADDGSGALRELGNAEGVITNRGRTVTLNGVQVVQNQIVSVPGTGLVITQQPGSANFHMPQELDDFQDGRLYQRYLRLDRVGVGSADAAVLHCSTDLTLYLRLESGKLEYRFNGGSWTDMAETPVIYAVYTVQGYELTVSKTVDMAESGEDAAFTDAYFTVIISSDQITDGKEYPVAGGDEESVTAAEGRLVLRIRHGDSLRIRELPHGNYTIYESDNESYTVRVRGGDSPNDVPLSPEGYAMTLDSPKKAALINTPKPICEIVDANDVTHLFYTLKSAVAYAKQISQANAQVTITMLGDYVMPAADAPVIDAGLRILLTGDKTILRGVGLEGPMITNRGTLTLQDLTLDGAQRAASGPMILQTTGSLTVGEGAVLQGAVSSGNGGAIRAEDGDVTVAAGAVVGGERTEEKPVNRAANGGAIAFGGTGTLTVSGGAIKGNDADGDGGAIWASGGTISITGGSISDNRAAGKGGAIFASALVSAGDGAVISGNRAVNGSAVFMNGGSASFSGANTGASITGNTATGEGGAVAVGSDTVQLSFRGKAKIKDNTKSGGAKANVWLDRDSDTIIFDDGVVNGAEIGIYVPDTEVVDSTGSEVTLFSLRGNVGTYFGSYAGSGASVGCFKNDRQDVTAVKDEKKEKILWGKAVSVDVYLLGLDTSNPDKPKASGNKIKTISFYPQSGWAMSKLAEEIYNRYGSSDLKTLPANAAYAYAFKEDQAGSYADYLTDLKWEDGQWMVRKRSGEWISLKTGNNQKKLIMYFAEPARLTIENNTEWELELSALAVSGRNVINTPDATGFGQVIAINGSIQTVSPVDSASLPNEAGSAVFVNDAGNLCLRANTTFQLWIPKVFGLNYALSYRFPAASGDSVELSRTGEDSQQVPLTGSLSGSLLSDPSQNYEIKFGGSRDICRVTTKDGVKHTYPSILAAIQNAMATAENGGLAELVTDASTGRKVFTVEMLTDYMIPAADTTTTALNITGCEITLTTAPELGRRATISRDQGNPYSFLNLKGKASTAAAERTSLTITDLDFDGKNLRGRTNGGGIVTDDIRLSIHNCSFTRFVANSGGALFAMYTPGFAGYNSVDDTLCVMEVTDSTFSGCTSKTVNSGSFSLHGMFTARQGGGAIWTEARKLVLSGCVFDNCKAEADGQTGGAQGGAVFHRIDGDGAAAALKHVYYAVSESELSFCTFTNCQAEAGGGLELDSYNAVVTGCTVSSCTSTKRNGGGMNMWIESKGNSCTGGKLTLKGCLFENCKATNASSNGGAVRSTALTNEISDCVIRDSECSNTGGALSLTNTNGNANSTITHVSISGCKSKSDGGGIYSVGKLTLAGGNPSLDPGSISYLDYPADVRALPYGSTITGNEATDGRGGGVYAAKNVTLSDGVMITGNRLGSGGSANVNNAAGLYFGGTTLTVGRSADGDDNLPDATTIDENYTSAGVRSNLRLPESSNKNTNCVVVNRSLSGKIYVVNAKVRDTQFGTGSREYAGLNDMNPAFRADDGSLWGIIQLTDTGGTKLVWAGPHLCKITDENNNLLYYKFGSGGVPCPAVFDILDDGTGNTGYSSAFALLRFSETECKFCDKDGNPYRVTGKEAKSVFKVKMLTESCSLTKPIETKQENASWQQIWLTTETERSEREEDPFPYHGEEGIPLCTIDKKTTGCERLINVRLGMRLENIVLDGKGYSTGSAGALCRVEKDDEAMLVVGQNAVLRNGRSTSEGGGVYVEQGSLSIIDGGVISSCKAKDGAGVYIKYSDNDASKASFLLQYGTVENCEASSKGGGVHVKTGSFTMTGGSIQGCKALQGGGVMVNAGMTMTMSGGSIRGNQATKKANSNDNGAGGIAAGDDKVRLYFSGKPIVLGNKDSGGNEANVLLNYDTNAIINVVGSGLVSGARVGVFVPDRNSLYSKHGVKDTPFGTHGENVDQNYLFGFINDRNGYRGGKKKDVNDDLVYWVEVFALEVRKEINGLPAYEEGTERTGEAARDFPIEVRLVARLEELGGADVLRDNLLGDVDPAGVTVETEGNTTVLRFSLKHDQSIMIMNLLKEMPYYVEERDDGAASGGRTQYGPQYDPAQTGIIGGAEGNRLISTVRVVNTQYVCKITDAGRGLLYHNGRPAVYTSLADALDALGSLKTKANKDNADSPYYSGAYHIEMLIPEYTVEAFEVTEVTVVGGEEVTQPRPLTVEDGYDVTLTTASAYAEDGYPYRPGEEDPTGAIPAVIFRGYNGGSLLTVAEEARLGLMTITLNGMAVLENPLDEAETHTTDADGGLVKVEASGTLHILGGALLKNSATSGSGGAVAVESGGIGGVIGGTVGMSGGTVTGCSGRDGGAFYLAPGGSIAGTRNSLTVTGGTVRDNYADGGNGGAFFLSANSTLSLSGGEITNNGMKNGSAVTGKGGAVYSEGSVTLSGSAEQHALLKNNGSSADGGAVYLASGSSFTMSAGEISGSTGGSGGAVYLAAGVSAEMSGGTVKENTAAVDGGAFYLAANSGSKASLSLSGGEVSANGSGFNGGAVYSKGGVTLGSVTVSGNRSGAAGDGGAFYLDSGSTITATAGEVSSNTGGRNGGAFYLAAGVQMEMSATAVKNNTAAGDGGAFYLASNGDSRAALTLKGGEVSGNSAVNGGAVYSKGSVTMSGSGETFGSLKNNQAGADGGAVYLAAGSSFTMSAGEISGNTGVRNGGAVYVSAGVSVAISTGEIKNNTATGDGGAFYLAAGSGDARASLSLSGGEVSGNNALNGGAVYSKGNVTLSGNAAKHGSMKNNRASTDGGAAYLAAGSSFTMSAGEISGNTGVRNGGAVYLESGVSVELTTGAVTENSAGVDGGAFYLAAADGAGSELTMGGGEVSANSASGDGGAFYLASGSVLTLNGGTVSANGVKDGAAVTKNGGAVYSLGSVTLGGDEETHAAVTGNSAKVDGGAVYIAAGSLSLSAGEIGSNTASGSGGAVYLAAGSSAVMSGGTVSGNASGGSGGAFYLAEGSEERKASLSLSGGAVTGNTIKADSPDGQGAGIYLSAESLLTLSGAPDFGGAETADGVVAAGGNRNLRTGLLVSGDANGRQSYTAARQDIYLSEKSGEKPATLHVTASFTASGEDLKAAEGSVWVWAEHEDHREMRKPFAVMDGEVSEEVGKLFRNAQTNALSLCSGEYLYGCPGDFSGTPSDPYLYWSGGIDVYFKKVDSYETDRRDAAGYPLGQQLAGAEFALYMTYDEALAGAVDGRVEVTAGDDTVTVFVSAGEYAVADKIKLKGSVVTSYQYNVTFSVVPGVYYMKETKAPEGYRPNPYVYKVYVGESNVPAKYGDSDYLILRMPNAETEDADPDILKFGIVNLPLAERKVILKNVDKAWQPLTDGTFDILFWDLSPYWYYVKDGEGKDRLVNTQDFKDGETGAFTVGKAGAFWTGRLPFGTYYLRKAGDPKQWYKFTVREGDRQVLEVEKLSAAPG